jgi:hypothetical protein
MDDRVWQANPLVAKLADGHTTCHFEVEHAPIKPRKEVEGSPGITALLALLLIGVILPLVVFAISPFDIEARVFTHFVALSLGLWTVSIIEALNLRVVFKAIYVCLFVLGCVGLLLGAVADFEPDRPSDAFEAPPVRPSRGQCQSLNLTGVCANVNYIGSVKEDGALPEEVEYSVAQLASILPVLLFKIEVSECRVWVME